MILLEAPALVGGEDDRIRAHFEWVLIVLRAQDVSHRDARFVAARARTLGLLEHYRDRGVFPRNRSRPDCMVPVFVDEKGVTCAVAQLMIDTGARELVATIHATQNLFYVQEMTSASTLAWIESAGLTPAEASLIQPDYCPQHSEPTECMYYNTCIKGSTDPTCCTYQPVMDGMPCGECDADGCSGKCHHGVCSDPGMATSDGCSCAMVGLATGAPSALLAALFLVSLSVRRRRASRVGRDRASSSRSNTL